MTTFFIIESYISMHLFSCVSIMMFCVSGIISLIPRSFWLVAAVMCQNSRLHLCNFFYLFSCFILALFFVFALEFMLFLLFVYLLHSCFVLLVCLEGELFVIAAFFFFFFPNRIVI